MPAAQYAARPADIDYGRVCPECAGPKHRQSHRCATCYYDARRRGMYPPPPTPARRPDRIRVTGAPRGRPQSQSHPWRGKNALLFRTRASEAVSPDKEKVS